MRALIDSSKSSDMEAARITVNGFCSQPQTVRLRRHNAGMDESNFNPAQVLAQNVKALLEHREGPSTQMDLATKSSVAQATIGRVLRAEGAATIDTVAQIARAYGLEGWQLLVAGMNPSN